MTLLIAGSVAISANQMSASKRLYRALSRVIHQYDKENIPLRGAVGQLEVILRASSIHVVLCNVRLIPQTVWSVYFTVVGSDKRQHRISAVGVQKCVATNAASH